MQVLLLFILAGAFYFPAIYFSKLYGMQADLLTAIKVQICFLFANICWLGIVYIKKDLFKVSIIWTVLGMTISFAVGVLMYHEQMKVVHILGLITAVISAILLML